MGLFDAEGDGAGHGFWRDGELLHVAADIQIILEIEAARQTDA